MMLQPRGVELCRGAGAADVVGAGADVVGLMLMS